MWDGRDIRAATFSFSSDTSRCSCHSQVPTMRSLEGITVVALEQEVAALLLTRQLADHGARDEHGRGVEGEQHE